MIYFLLSVMLIFILDRVTKLWALKELQQPITIIPNVFSLRLAENKGAAFSLFSSGNEILRKVFLLIVPAFVVVAIFYYVLKKKNMKRWVYTSLGLIVGGALGNLYDRLLSGKVVDFIDIHFKNYHYPTFNVADIGVFVGTVLLLIFYRKS